MKKRTIVLLALVLVIAVAAVGCGKMTLQEFVKKADLESQIDAVSESMGDVMTISLETTDNELILKYTIAEGIPAESLTEDVLASAVESGRPMMEPALEEIKKEVDVENPSIVFLFEDSEGNELYRDVIQ